MYKVLLVEDELLVRVGLKSSIDWQNFDMELIDEASNGKIAYEKFLKYMPDIVITDIKMPVMDGFSLIEKIREVNKNTKIIILTCVEDFDFAKKAIKLNITDYITKLTMTTDEINNILLSIKNELDTDSNSTNITTKNTDMELVDIEEKILLHLLYGTYTIDEINQIPFPYQNIIITKFQIQEYKKLQLHFKDKHGQLVNFTFKNLMSEIISRNFKHIIINETESEYLILIFTNKSNSNKSDLIMLNHSLVDINETIHTYFNTKCIIVMDKPINTISEIKNSYIRCNDVLDKKFFFDIGDIIIINEHNLEILKKNFYKNATLMFEDINNTEIINTLNEKIKLMEFSENTFKNFFKYIYISSLERKNIKGNLFYDKITNFIHDIEYTHNIYILIKIFINHINDIYSIEITQYSKEIAMVIDYIDNNYNKQIKLIELSTYVNLSPNYLSHLFKKETGLSIFSHINKQRIDKAIELLVNTDKKNYEIASDIGFKDESYFNKTFKQITNKRPNDYRKITSHKI